MLNTDMTNKLFDDKHLKKLKDTFSNLKNDDEFEIMFGGYNKTNSLNMKQFLDLIKYFKDYADKNKLKIFHTESLDLSYNYDKKNFHTYRISIEDIENINSLMSTLHKRENQIIFSVLSSKLYNNENTKLSIINKKKDYDNTFDLDEYDVRVRLSEEKSVSKKELGDLINLNNLSKMAINFRMKSRISIIQIDNADVKMRIDLTSVKQGNNINILQNVIPNYELEIDYQSKKKAGNSSKYFNELLKNIEFVKKTINQSNHIIKNSEIANVMKRYNKLIYNEENHSSKTLYGMVVKSLEVVHLVDFLPNKYAICDKADGDRCMGIIIDNKLYLIFTNLEVKYSGIEIKNKEYNDTILDGEYIYDPNENKFLFLCFDILFYKGENIQNDASLESRYMKLKDVIKVCFGFYHNFKKYDGDFDMGKIEKYYREDLLSYLKLLNSSLKKEKNETFVCDKYFIFPLGGLDCEIFKYTEIIWDTYTKLESKLVPYILDGVIYTGTNQIYTKSLKDIKYKIYKWKPPNKNSIDFYIKFEKDSQTGKQLNVFDLTNEDNEGATYKIINLHVGKLVNNIEVPVLFRKNENLNVAKIKNNDGIIRDIEGDILQDNTVVEFYYDDNPEIPSEFRWVPLRTRYDKTESVLKQKKKYGNNSEIANAIWSSMQEKITIDDIKKLGDPELYNNEILEIKKRIDATVVAIEKQKDIYYQKITDFAKPLRNFHNYIKSNIIFTYCSPKYINKSYKKMSVLDVGVGRGGDIQKFFHSKVGKYVGIDPDSHGIHSSTDGAISRYNNFRKKMPNFPKMDFIVADAGTRLDADSQVKSLGKMSDSNINLIKEHFTGQKYDIFNCQLMIHFLLKDESTWNNFCYNINTFLEDDGYVLITTFDGEKLHKLFNKGKGSIVEMYTEEGNKKKFFEFRSNYNLEDKNINKLGLSYDSFVAMFKDAENFDTEYLVPEKFLIESLKKNCNLDLLEMNDFYQFYEQQKDFFQNIAPNEENRDSKNFFMKISQYYDLEDDVNRASLEFTKLHKYYIFRKNSIKKVSKVDSHGKVDSSSKNIKKSSLIDKYLNSESTISF